MNDLSDKGFADRAHINTTDSDELHRWSRQFRVPKEELLRVIEKVGNAASAVRKELDRVREQKKLKAAVRP